MNRSISFLGQAASRTAGTGGREGATNAQCLAYGAPSEIRFLHRLYARDTTVFIGEEISQATVFPRRFTHIWTRSPGALQLRFSQTTYQALEDFNPDSKARPVIPQT